MFNLFARESFKIGSYPVISKLLSFFNFLKIEKGNEFLVSETSAL